jgi:U3 small nucleolar RNA-associated protein 4
MYRSRLLHGSLLPSPPPSSGHELLRITAASHSSSDTSIWSLLLLPDGTIVSGDSEGAVQFWEGTTGTLICRLQNHAADVLTLAYSAGHVFAAGVDPRVSWRAGRARQRARGLSGRARRKARGPRGRAGRARGRASGTRGRASGARGRARDQGGGQGRQRVGPWRQGGGGLTLCSWYPIVGCVAL